VEYQWQKHHTELLSYIAANPSIVIEGDVVRIPGDVRERFYSIFNRIRQSFVEENYAPQLAMGKALSNAWAEIIASTEQTGFGPVDISANVNCFMLNPLDGLMRQLLGPANSLLRRKIDILGFEQQGHKEVSEAFESYYRLGYMYWVQLALIKALQIDKNYRVPVIDSSTEVAMGEGHETPGFHVDNVPELEERAKVSFIQHPTVSFMTSQVIVHSTKLKGLVGLCSDFVEPHWSSCGANNSLEWFDLPALLKEHKIDKPRPDYRDYIKFNRIMSDVLVYTTNNTNNIKLVADHYRFLRPDLCLEVMAQSDWYEKGKLEIVKKHHSVMQPRRGTYVICLEQPPQAAIDELMPKSQNVKDSTGAMDGSTQQADAAGAELSSSERVEQVCDIHLVHVGLDASKLGTIVDAMSSKQ